MNSSRLAHQTQTRARILESARSELEVHGYRDANTARIAHAAGVAHGTVFLHFSTREQLLDAIVLSDALADAAEALPHLRASASLGELLTLHLRQLSAHLPFARLLARELPFLSPSLRAHILVSRTALVEAMRLSILAGQEAGTFKPGDPAVLLAFWLGAIERHLVHPDLLPPLTERGPALRDTFLDMLTIEQPGRRSPDDL